MALKNFTTEEKLDFIRAAIIRAGHDGNHEQRHHVSVLKSIAVDLQARLDGAPTAAFVQLNRRIDHAINTKANGDYNKTAMLGLAYEVIGRWPAIKQALELFVATMEAASEASDS